MKPRDQLKLVKRKAATRTFVEIYINGIHLYQLLEIKEDWHLESDFYYNREEAAASVIKRLSLDCTSPLKSGRIMLFSCTECGDIGCGAITLQAYQKDQSVVWENFLWENGYAPIQEEDYFDIGPFVFDTDQYFDIIS